MNRDLNCGGEHTIECTDDVLYSCAPETGILLITSVIPINSLKRERREMLNNLFLIILKNYSIFKSGI